MTDKIPFYIDIKPSTSKDKKLMAIFYNKNKQKIKTVHFGQSGASDYTIHKDEARKNKYIDRHEKNEDWKAPMTAGALSRWLLWSETSLKLAISKYLSKFNLKLL